MRSSLGVAAAAVGVTLLAPGQAWADCLVGGVTVQCDNTVTTDTTFPASPPADRAYQGLLATPIVVTVDPGTTVSGNGLAFTNLGTGGVTVTNNGTISVDAGNTPTAGGTAALSISAAGGPITYTGGSIINNGSGNAFDARQTGGVGSVNINISGATSSANGEGVVVRDVATSTGISITTGAVTALTAGKDGIDAQSQSLTGNITEVANGNIQAGNAGMVAAILNAAGTGNIDVTANGSIDARFGIDAENFGSGNTFVTTVGPVNVTTGNGIFALSTGGHVIVNAGDVTATGNTAIIAQQTKAAGTGVVGVTAGNVSGTTGIDARNFGTGAISISTIGTVTGTFAEGIKANGNAGVAIAVADTVTGATRGLSLIGGTGGTGDISVAGTGGFVGGTGDAANILNNGSGTVTVDISGASSSAGGEGFVIRDTAIGGNISVTTGAITALTLGKDGIDVQTQSTTANINEVANGNIQAGNAGMVAAILNAASTGNVDVTANGSIDARFGIDAENFGSGNTFVTTVGPVNVTTGNGIFALSTGGHVIVNAGDVTATGNTAIIAQQTKAAGTGVVGVTAGNVSGTTGIDARNFGTGAISISTIGTVTGTFAEGIKANGNASVFVAVNQTVTGATRGLSLIGGTGGTGNIGVLGAGGFVGGTDDAANIKNNGSGTVTVAVSGASSSTGGEGFVVRDTAAGGDISVTTGAITALTLGKDGIDVQTQSTTANVTEFANGNIQAGNAGMVAAILNAASTGNINVTANGSIDARFGIDAENFGSGSTTVTTVGPVNVTTGNGIFALSTGGHVIVNAGDVTATSNTAIIAQQTKAAGTGVVGVTAGNVSGTTGIDARNFGTGEISISTVGTVTGTFAEGIKANGNAGVAIAVADTVTGATRGLSLIGGTGGTGDISVAGTGGFVGGTDDAVNIKNNGAGTVTVDISGASSSAGGEGFVIRDTAVGGDISVTTGAVTALTLGKDGIDVQTQSTSANVTEVANGNIQAGNAGMVAAILNAASTGNVDVTANGEIDARFGIDAENFGTGSTTVTTLGPVTATSGNGIFALSTTGNVTVTAENVTSTGNTAIVAQQTSAAGAGAVDVTANEVSGTTGILALNIGTGAIGITANGTVIGTLAEGIKATGNGAVTVNVADMVTGATRGLSLIGGTGGTGNILVTGTGGFFGGTGDAANILNNGSGTVTVDISGASGSNSNEGIVVRDTAIGGDISVTTGAVTALAGGKDSIDVQAQSLTGNITIVANGDIEAGNAGIVAAIFPAAATGNIDVTANGAINARFGIDAENFGVGSTAVTTIGPVNVTTGNGIFALATSGAVAVTAGDVTSTGNTAIIAQHTGAAGSGAVDVTAGNVSGTTGILAFNNGSGAIGITANGTVTGTAAEGINANGRDAVTVNVANTVTGATRGLSLIGGTGGSGDISVTGAGGFVGGTDDAANIRNNGSGSVTVDVAGASSSAGGYGFIVRDTAAGGDISVTTGAVTALTLGKNAIDVITQSTIANVTEIANGNIQAGNAGMVAAILNAAATGHVNVTANGSIDARFGIDAENFGSGSTVVTTVGPVNATSGNGIFALSTSGIVLVAAGDVTSTGNTAIIAQQTKVAGTGLISVVAGNVSGTTGIDARNFGTGDIGISTTGTVTGTLGEGIYAVGNAGVSVLAANTVTGATRGLSLVGGTGGTGDILVAGANGFVGGTDDAANIRNNGSGSVTVDVAGASSSAGGYGFIVRDTAAGGDISVTTGAVTALTLGKNAIDVITQSTTANVTEVANGDIQAGNAAMVAAILNAAANGEVNVTANGSIDARFGIDAENFGSGDTLVTTVGPVNVTSGNGIFALTTGGNVTVNAGDVTSTGNTAIIAQQTAAAGVGTVDVTAGNVSGTTGITATNFGTGTLGVTTLGTVTGTAAEGIKATGNDAVTITVADTVTGATRGLSLVGGTGGSGDILVTGAGGFVGGTDDAVNIKNNGAGTTTVNISGASSSTDGNGIFVRDTAIGGNISVTTGAVTALTAGKNAIDVISSSAAGNVTVVANGNVQAGNAGIIAALVGAATGNVDVTANGSLTARFGVDAENFGTGSTSVTTVGPVDATTGNGIFALTKGGNVTVNAGAVTATGNTAIIAQQTAVAGAGAINVTAGNVSGTTGIVALNSGTGAIGITANGTVTGTGAEGILATGNGAVSVAVTNTVTAATRGLSLSGGTGGTGNISVTGAGGFAGGTGDAANIANNGAGTVTYNVSGASSSSGGNGIVVGDTALGGSISITTGAVTALTAGKNAVYAVSASLTGNVTEVANGDIRAGNAGMVAAILPAAATGNVNVTANGSVDARFGIDAENQGLGTTTVTTVGPVTATTGTGVYALSHNGNVAVTTGNVSSTGSTGIFAAQTGAAGTGVINVTANGSTGGTTGIAAQNLGTGTTIVTTVGPVTATTGNGIFAMSNGGNVTVTTGSVSSTGASAIVAQDAAVGANTGKINVTLTAGSTVTANAAGAFGIRTNSSVSSGTTTITVNGTIHAAAAGISSSSTSGSIVTNIGATGAIDPLIGIDQATVSGAITVNNAGLVEGDNIGVRLTSTGAGAVGALTVNQIGSGTIGGILGVDLASVDAALVVNNGGLISGTTGVRMTATGTGTGTIVNSGTLTGTGNAVTATLNNTSFTLANTGTLNGAINVTGSNVATSTMTNAAGATANFGSGSSSFSGSLVNAGTANIGAGGTVTFLGNTANLNRINFVGAGSFTTNGAMANTGIINAQNNITSNVVTVGGAYSGGGQFFADYSTVTATADRLNIAGAASGNTNVTMNRVGARSFVAGGFLPVVTVTPGAAVGTFTSNTVFPTTGLILESFGRNPAGTTQFGLIQQINPSAAALGNLSYVAESASMLLDEPISPYVMGRTDATAGGKSFSLWMRGASGHTKQNIASTITGGGVSFGAVNRIRTEHQAIQMGADFGILMGGGWNVHLGVLGGWYDGAAVTGAERVAVDASFVGAYAAVSNGAFTLDGTVRREWRKYDMVLPTLFGSGTLRKVDGRATAGAVRASYRFGGATGFAAMPFAGFSYADSEIDALPIDADSIYMPGKDKTKIGQAGARVSYRVGSADKIVVEPFVSAAALKNWSAGDHGSFSFGTPATVFALDTKSWDDAVRYSVGLMGHARDGRISAFVAGNVDDGDDLDTFSLNAGIRFNF